MQVYEVTLGKGGSGTIKLQLPAQSPAQAKSIAEHQYPGYTAQSTRAVFG